MQTCAPRCFTKLMLACVLVMTLIEWSALAAPSLDDARAAVARATLEPAARQAAEANIDAAFEADRAAAALAERVSALRTESAQEPERVARLESALAVDPEQAFLTWVKRLPTDADGETLEGLLQQERRTAVEVQAQIDAVNADLSLALARPAQAASDIGVLRRRIEELSVAMSSQDDEAGVLSQTRRLARASEVRLAQVELELRAMEQDNASARQRVLELTLRELRHRIGLSQRRVEELQQRIANLWRSEIDTRMRDLAEREHSLTGSPRVVALAAAENAAVGAELIENHEQLARERRTLTSIEEERDYVTEALRDSRTRLELGGANERVGRWLWGERRRLEPLARLRHAIDTTRITLADLRLRMVTISDQQEQLSNIPRALLALLEASEAGADDEQSDAGAEELLPPLLRERVELLAMLRPLLERRIAALEQSEIALRDRLAATEDLQRLLDRHLLWLPSHSMVDGQWLSRVPDGILDLVKPSRFATTFELAARSVVERPAMWFAVLVLLLVLVGLRMRAPARIASYASAARGDDFVATIAALLWTLIGALPGPVALGLIGLLLQQLGTPGRFSDSLGVACVALIAPLAAVQLMRWTIRDQGLADAHFGWMQQRRRALGRWLPFAALSVLPMYFVAELAFARRGDLAIDVHARLAIVVAAAAAAWAFWHLLSPGTVWVERSAVVQVSTSRFVLRLLIPLLLLASAGLSMAGYISSADALMQALLASVGLIIVLSVGLAVLTRWLLVGERRLARRRFEVQQATAPDATAGGGEAFVTADATDLSLAQVSAQTTRLLRALRAGALVLGLLWVWVDVLPAVYRLDEIAVWHFSETNAEGLNVEQPVTLAAMLLGAFALIVTIVASRNLPGLIEIGLLSRAGMDAASRYAVTSLLRYGIVIGGTLIGLGLLGMRWSQLQWMAAALTVGLGFGLQEIFAN